MNAMLKQDKTQPIRKIFSLVIVAGLAMGLPAAKADDSKWSYYQSDTGIFEVQVPTDLKEETTTFRIDSERVVNSSRAISVHDQRTFKDTFKTYLVQIDQTIGPALTHNQIETFLTYDLNHYIERYDGMNPVLKSSEFKYYRNLPGLEMNIEYEDPDLGPQNTRVRIIYTDATRVEQSLTGDTYVMYGYKADKFFETLSVNGGITYEEGKFDQTWGNHTSPLGIFSVSLPPISPPYVMDEPKIAHSKKSELISQTIFDPVWGHKVFYRVYGYKFDRPLALNNVQQVLFEKHISKYKKDASSFDYKKSATEKHRILETEMSIRAPSKAPYANFVRLRIFYADKYMLVQEIISSKDFIKSPMVDNMMDLIVFHPEQAEKMPESAAAPEETTEPEEDIDETSGD